MMEEEAARARPGSVAEEIRDGLATASSTERRVAHALLADYPILALGTLADWAGRAAVSTPTILRYLTKLGFGSFPDFQARLRAELSDRLRSPLDKTPAAPSSGGERSAGFARAVSDNILETFAHLPESEGQAVIALLADPRRKIALVGGRFTDPLARYAAAHLTIVRNAVSSLNGLPDNWRDKLLDLDRGDVLIVFDIRRYTPELLKFAEQAAARKIVVVLVTDQWLSPVARVASHILPARIAVPSRWDSNAALMAIVEMLLEGVTSKLGSTAERRIGDLEALRGSSDT